MAKTTTDNYSLGSVAVSLTPIERFEEYLRSKNLRMTEQRRFLVNSVFSQHEHFDADQLLERMPGKNEENYVSRPTVYRTLKEFVDAGLLRSFELNGRAVYEHDYGYPPHDHLYCTECEQLFEFQSDEIMALRESVAREHRFRVRTHRLTIHGICASCAKSNRGRRRQDRV